MFQWSLVSTSRRFNLPRIWIWGGRCIKCWLGESGAILLKKNFRLFKIAIWKVKACLELIFWVVSESFFFGRGGGGGGGGEVGVFGEVRECFPSPPPTWLKTGDLHHERFYWHFITFSLMVLQLSILWKMYRRNWSGRLEPIMNWLSAV